MPTIEHVRKIMRANRSQHTRPEITVRKLLTQLVYRYRLHARDLPGRPDIVFRSRRKVILVHGCFWHQHDSPNCRLRSHPVSNVSYWAPKLARNKQRDADALARLIEDGWQALTIWECELAASPEITKRLKRFLGTTKLSDLA